MVALLLALAVVAAMHQRNPNASRWEGFYSFVKWPEGITTLAVILTLGAIVW